MERNNPLFIALLPYIGSAVGLAAVGAGAWWVNRNVTAAQAARDVQIQQQAEVNRAQAYSSQIQSQIMIERFTPVLWATVPAMVLVGAYFMWKAKRDQDQE